MFWDTLAAIGGGILGGIFSSEGSKDAAKTQAAAANAATKLQYDIYQQQRSDLAPWRNAGIYGLNALIGTGGTGTTPSEAGGYWTEPQYEQQITGYRNTTNWDGIPIQEPVYGNVLVKPSEWVSQSTTGTTGATGTGTEGLIQKGPGEFKESPSYQFALDEGLRAQQRAASATGRLGSGAYLRDATEYAKNLASEEYQNFLNRWYQSLNPYFSLAGMGQLSATNTANAAGQYGQQAGQNTMYAGQSTAAGQLGQSNTLANMFNWGGQQLGNYTAQNNMQNSLRAYNNPGSYYGNTMYSPSYGYMNPQQVNSMSWL